MIWKSFHFMRAKLFRAGPLPAFPASPATAQMREGTAGGTALQASQTRCFFRQSVANSPLQ